MNQIYAHPILQTEGFHFSSQEEFQECGTELAIVYELSLVNASSEDQTLFNICKVDVNDMAMWFDEIEPLDTTGKAAMFYLIDGCHHTAKTALAMLSDVDIFCGTLVEAATELFDDIYLSQIPTQLQTYVDYEQFATDLRMGGDIYEFEFAGQIYTCTNAHNH